MLTVHLRVVSDHAWRAVSCLKLAVVVGAQAVRPKFLSAKWEVGHAAAREFGPYSIYAAGGAQDPGAAGGFHVRPELMKGAS